MPSDRRGQRRILGTIHVQMFALALVLVPAVSASSRAGSRSEPASPQASTQPGQPPEAPPAQKISDIVRKISDAYSKLATYQDDGDIRWTSTFPDGHVTTEQQSFSTSFVRDSALQWTRRSITPKDSVGDAFVTLESIGRGEFVAKDAKGEVIASNTDAGGLVEELSAKAGQAAKFDLLALGLLHACSPARVAAVLGCTKESDWRVTAAGDQIILIQTFSEKGLTQTTELSFDAQTFLLRKVHFTRSILRPNNTNEKTEPALKILQSFPDSELTIVITPGAMER